MEIIAVIIGLILMVLAWYRFPYAFGKYIAIKPFLVKSWVLFYLPNFPLVTLDRFIFLSLIILYLIRFYPEQKRTQKLQIPFLTNWLGLIIPITILSVLNSYSVGNTMKGILVLGVEYFTLFALTCIILKEAKHLRFTIKMLVISFLVILGYGLFVKFTGHNDFILFFEGKGVAIGHSDLVMAYEDDNRFGISGRIQSVFIHPIGYSGVLALLLPFSTLWMWKTGELKFKLGWLMFSALLVVNLFLTNSRSGMLISFITLIPNIFAIWHYKNVPWNKVIIAFAALSVVIMLALNIQGMGSHIRSALFFWENTDVHTGSTVQDRVEKLTFVYNELGTHQWIGKGFGSADVLKSAYPEKVNGLESFWLVNLYEHGILGVLTYALFFIGIIARFIFELIKIEEKYRQLLALNLIFIILGYVLFISITGELGTFPYFLLIWALSYNAIQDQNEKAYA